MPDSGRNLVRHAVRRQLAVRPHTVADLHAGIRAALRVRPGRRPPPLKALKRPSRIIVLSLYEEDPGPTRLNVGSEAEPRYVPRSEALRDYYARWLVKELGADQARLGALADACRSELAATGQVRHWARLAVRRLRERGPLTARLRCAVQLADSAAREEVRLVHRCSVELCERAGEIVRGSGAASDPAARRRLLAGLEHQLTVETIGFLPSVAESSAEELVQRLRQMEE
jgi:hypothetical protein